MATEADVLGADTTRDVAVVPPYASPDQDSVLNPTGVFYEVNQLTSSTDVATVPSRGY